MRHLIIVMTNGKGVNILYNSSIEASYECIAEHGRVIEIRKNYSAENKKRQQNLSMAFSRTDITIIIVDVYSCLMTSLELKTKFFDWMHENSSNGCVKPLNKTVFNANEAEKAFKLHANGSHIGKIVIKMRDEEIVQGHLKNKPAPIMTVLSKTYFNPNKVYIITGGLGWIRTRINSMDVFVGRQKVYSDLEVWL